MARLKKGGPGSAKAKKGVRKAVKATMKGRRKKGFDKRTPKKLGRGGR
jgi:hypothetical protein